MRIKPLLLTAAAALACHAQEVRAEQADLVITHARVVSPPDILDDMTVVVKAQRIESVGKGPIPKGAKRYIDARGKTLIPGLIDLHVHLIIGPDGDESYERAIRTVGAQKLKGFLSRGFTTIYSPGDYWPQILKVRNRLDQGQMLGPRLLISGPMITCTSGHPTDVTPECLNNPYCRSHWAAQVDDVAAAKKLVDELADGGVDVIKVAYNPASVSPDGTHIEAPAREVVKALIDAAHARGLPVNAFTADVKHSADALDLGANLLSHPPYDGSKGLTPSGDLIPTEELRTFITRARKHNLTITTTASESWPLKDYWNVTRMAHTGVTYKEALMLYGVDIGEMTPEQFFKQSVSLHRFFDQHGVNLAYGSGTFRLPSDLSESIELKALALAGLSPMKILNAATRAAAAAVGQKDLGVIASGKRADMVLLSDDPLKSVDALDSIQWVMKDGKIVYRSCDPWRTDLDCPAVQ